MSIRTSITKSSGYEWLSPQEIGLLMSEPEPERIIHNGRNRLWICRLRDEVYVVKHFRKSVKNMLFYRFGRSKAAKSWHNATELTRRGINTPAPVAYVDTRNAAGCLLDCRYICRYEPSESLFQAIEKYGNEAIESFAGFVNELHLKGIRHDDLNNTNVRVAKVDGEFVFSLIDLNRMKIYPDGMAVPLDGCFKNVCRFCCLDNFFDTFITAYLNKRHFPLSHKKTAVRFKNRHDRMYDLRKMFKL